MRSAWVLLQSSRSLRTSGKELVVDGEVGLEVSRRPDPLREHPSQLN